MKNYIPIAIVAFFFFSCQSKEEILQQQYSVEGMALYQTHCENCHQADGAGLRLKKHSMQLHLPRPNSHAICRRISAEKLPWQRIRDARKTKLVAADRPHGTPGWSSVSRHVLMFWRGCFRDGLLLRFRRRRHVTSLICESAPSYARKNSCVCADDAEAQQALLLTRFAADF